MKKLLLAMMLTGTTLALADTIEEKRIKADTEKDVAFEIKSMNKACNTAIAEAGYIDWTTWKTVDNQVRYACKYVPYGIASLCRSDKIAQETVAKDIKKLSCVGDGGDDLKLELKGATLVAHTKGGVKDADKKTKNWLTKNLQ